MSWRLVSRWVPELKSSSFFIFFPGFSCYTPLAMGWLHVWGAEHRGLSCSSLLWWIRSWRDTVPGFVSLSQNTDPQMAILGKWWLTNNQWISMDLWVNNFQTNPVVFETCLYTFTGTSHGCCIIQESQWRRRDLFAEGAAKLVGTTHQTSNSLDFWCFPIISLGSSWFIHTRIGWREHLQEIAAGLGIPIYRFPANLPLPPS
jgi:hypothetical protein